MEEHDSVSQSHAMQKRRENVSTMSSTYILQKYRGCTCATTELL